MGQLKIQLMNCNQIQLKYKQGDQVNDLSLDENKMVEINNEMISFILSDDYELYFNELLLEEEKELKVEAINILQVYRSSKLEIKNNGEEKIKLTLEGSFECYQIVLKAHSNIFIKLINDEYLLKGNNTYYLDEEKVNKIMIPCEDELIINQVAYAKVDIYYDCLYPLETGLNITITKDQIMNYYCLEAMNQYHLLINIPCNSEFLLVCDEEVYYQLDNQLQNSNLIKIGAKRNYELKISLKKYVEVKFRLENPFLTNYVLRLKGYETYEIDLSYQQDYVGILPNVVAGEYEVELSDGAYFKGPWMLEIVEDSCFSFEYIGKVITFQNETKLNQSLLFYDEDEVKQILIMPYASFTYQSLNDCLKVICVHPNVMMIHGCEVIMDCLDLKIIKEIKLVMNDDLVEVKGMQLLNDNEYELEETLCFTLVSHQFSQQYYLNQERLLLSLNKDCYYEVICDDGDVYINDVLTNCFYLNAEKIKIVIIKKVDKEMIVIENEDNCLIQLVSKDNNYVIDNSCCLEMIKGSYQLIGNNVAVIYHDVVYYNHDYICLEDGFIKVEALLQVTLISKERSELWLANTCYEVPGIYYLPKGVYDFKQDIYLDNCLYHNEIYLDHDCIIDLNPKLVNLWIESDCSTCLTLNEVTYCIQEGRQVLSLYKDTYCLETSLEAMLDGENSNILNLCEDEHELKLRIKQVELNVGFVKMVDGGACLLDDDKTYEFSLKSNDNKYNIKLNKANNYRESLRLALGSYELISAKACHLRLNQVEVSTHFDLEENSQLLIIQDELKQNLYLELFKQQGQSLFKPKLKEYIIKLENDGQVNEYSLNENNNYQAALLALNQGMYRISCDYNVVYMVNGKDASKEAIISLQDEASSVTIIERLLNKLILKSTLDEKLRGHIKGMKLSKDFVLAKELVFDDLVNGIYVISFDEDVNYCLDQGSVSDKGLVLMSDDEHELLISKNKVSLSVQKYLEHNKKRSKAVNSSKFILKKEEKEYLYEFNQSNNYTLFIDDLPKGDYTIVGDDDYYLDAHKVESKISLSDHHVLGVVERKRVTLKIIKRIRDTNDQLIIPAAYDVYQVMIKGDEERVVRLNQSNNYEVEVVLKVGHYEIKEIDNSNYVASYRYQGREDEQLNIALNEDSEVMIINELKDNQAIIDVFQYQLNDEGKYVAPTSGEYHFIIQNDYLKHEYVLNEANHYHVELKEYVSGDYEIKSLDANMQYLLNSPTLTNQAIFKLQPQSNLVIAIVEVINNNLVTLNLVKQVKGGKPNLNKSYLIKLYKQDFNEVYSLNKDNNFKLRIKLEPGIYMIEEIDETQANFIFDGVKLRKAKLVLNKGEHECIVENKADLDIITLSL